MENASLRPAISLVLGVGVALVASIAPARSVAGAPARPAATPSLRMVAPDHDVTAFKFKKQPAKLDAEVFIAAPGAPFEFRLERPAYDEPIHVYQVIDGKSHRLPDDVLQGWDGFASFFKLQAKDAAGNVVYEGTQRFCPSAEERRPLDIGDLRSPQYILGCQANEFTKGMRWGIEEGWAAEAFGDRGARIDVPPGRYSVTISITKRFRRLFDIAKADSKTVLDVTVEKTNECFKCDEYFEAPGNEPLPGLPVPETTDPNPELLPDLIPLPPYGINVVNDGQGSSFLGFAAHVWVAGGSDLVVEGYREPDDPRLDAYQYFYVSGVPTSRANVGHFHYDNRDGHDHWHLDRFSVYRLVDADGSVITSEKQGFCLGPTSPTDLTIPGAVQQDILPQYETTCGVPESSWIREVIPLGWGDTYHQSLPGQSFDITDLPNGKYFIEIQANPDGFLYEQDLGNDTIRRKVVLRGTPGHRRVDFGPVR
jgi:hypothetical protein